MTVKMVVTDLDGTLLRDDKSIDIKEYETFVRLGELGIIRVAATGRSLHSVRAVIPPHFPFDYIVFSTGSGIFDCKTQTLLHENSLTESQIKYVMELFQSERLDYTVHFPIPENHCFHYDQPNKNNAGFNHYLEFYNKFAHPINGDNPPFVKACQLLAIMDFDLERFARISSHLLDYKVIRTTSPVDHTMLWMEVFPKNVSKGDAVHWLCNLVNINKSDVLAIGNDFNDIDVLDYVGHARLVENGHPELLHRYQLVASNNTNGVSKAIWALINI